MRDSMQSIVDCPTPSARQSQSASFGDAAQLRLAPRRVLHLLAQLTSFVGRERELTTIVELLERAHLLTLIGSGGSGKTRLALRAAEDLVDSFADGVWWVELGALEDAALLPQVGGITALDRRQMPEDYRWSFSTRNQKVFLPRVAR